MDNISFTMKNFKMETSVNLLEVNQAQTLSVNRADFLSKPEEVKPETSFDKEKGIAYWENENYQINFNEKSSELHIYNKNTNEAYIVWGDPHVTIGEGKDQKKISPKENREYDFDFKKDARFTLEDGTEIHIQTTPWLENGKAVNGMTLASDILIQDAKSDHAFKITGLDQNKLGDMTAQELTDMEVSHTDRITPYEGLQLIERAGSENKGFSLQKENGEYEVMNDKHSGNTKNITAMENFLAQHHIPYESLQQPHLFSPNQQAVISQLQDFMDMALNSFASNLEIPTGVKSFQQISTIIQGQNHAVTMGD